MKNKSVVFTGGHAGSAGYAVIQNLNKHLKRNVKVYWIGPERSMEGNKTKTLEMEMLPRLGVIYIKLFSGRLQRQFTLWTIPSILKVPIGVIQAIFILIKAKPQIVFTFGGYTSVPVCVAAYLLGIPILLHEQTACVGRANQLIARFSRVNLLARNSSKIYFPKKNTWVVGNPVREEIKRTDEKSVIPSTPLILVIGGSRGSVVINRTLVAVLTRILGQFKVIHITGETDFENILGITSGLPKRQKKLYRIIPKVSYEGIAGLYRKADIAICRSGANTVSELLIMKIPSILIPIPFSYKNEQFENALVAKDQGLAEIIEQKDLTPEILYQKIIYVHSNWHQIVLRSKSANLLDKNAAGRISEKIMQYLS